MDRVTWWKQMENKGKLLKSLSLVNQSPEFLFVEFARCIYILVESLSYRISSYKRSRYMSAWVVFFLIKETNFLGFILDDCNKNFLCDSFKKKTNLKLKPGFRIYDDYLW